VHEGDLPGRSAEVDEAEPYPESRGLTEGDVVMSFLSRGRWPLRHWLARQRSSYGDSGVDPGGSTLLWAYAATSMLWR
jgi:hypothetical protein